MTIIRRYSPTTIAFEDARYEHFLGGLVASLGGKLLSAAGKGIGWAAGKVAGLLAPAAKTAVSEAFTEGVPDPEYYPEDEEQSEELGDLAEVRISDDGREISITSPLFAALDDADIDAMAVHMAPYMDDALQIRDDDEPLEDGVEYGFVDAAEPIHHFKKKLKKLKKITKKVGGLVGKLAPVVSLIPGVGTVAGAALGAAGGIMSGKKPKEWIKGAVLGALPGGIATLAGGALNMMEKRKQAARAARQQAEQEMASQQQYAQEAMLQQASQLEQQVQPYAGQVYGGYQQAQQFDPFAAAQQYSGYITHGARAYANPYAEQAFEQAQRYLPATTSHARRVYESDPVFSDEAARRVEALLRLHNLNPVAGVVR